MNPRVQLVIAISVLLNSIPLVAESTQIIPDLTSGGQTITTTPPLTDTGAPVRHPVR